MRGGAALLAVLWWCAARGDDWSDCANITACACKWSGGKKTAWCGAAGILIIPHLSQDIQVLDLHENALGTLHRDAFATAGLLNLQRVNLHACGLHTMHADAFRSLRILVELDLGGNSLQALTPGTFKGNERLRLLILSGNPLSILQRDQFPPLPHLRTLEFEGCRLHRVHERALDPNHLPQLDSLDLRRNRLRALPAAPFRDLPRLKTLMLAGNPWRCDCRLREFRTFVLASNFGNERLQCAEPLTLTSNRTWRDLNEQDMICAPEVKPSGRIVRAEIGSDVVFGCLVRGDPKPEIRWLFDGIEVSNGSVDGEVEETYLITPDADQLSGESWWANITIVNVTVRAEGEWTCVAQSSAGKARSAINLVLPRPQTATARTDPGLPTLLGAVLGALIALTALGLVATSACWHLRRRRLPPSRSFTDQEKRLLDASVVVSCDRSIADMGSPCDFELTQRSFSLGDDAPRTCTFDPVHITIEGTPGCAGFPPPPAEFALPAPYGNIYISVSVAGATQDPSRQFPDLLGNVGGATLPRRARAPPGPTYDNMGPRVTAAGSSTWSLPGSEGVIVPISVPLTVAPPPPPDFVSL